METFNAHTLEGAVAAIYPDIEERVQHFRKPADEETLWKELSICLLSSQTPFAVALSASDAISDARLLYRNRYPGWEALALEVERVLCRPVMVGHVCRRYRFPKSKAAQLAKTWFKVREDAGSLGNLLQGFPSAEAARTWFVQSAPGIGPKQASMFLRNIGHSYNLAVIDRHVLNYMNTVGLSSGNLGANRSGENSYYDHERKLRWHADKIGYRVGVMDWAIWIVMRAARNLTASKVVP